MGLPLFLAIITFAIAVVLAVSTLFVGKKAKENLQSVATLFIMLEIFLVIVAAITRDPILDNISPEIQVITLGIGGITGFWKLILAPIFNRLTKLEVGQGEIKTDVSNIKTDVHLIKEKLLSVSARKGSK